MGLGLGLSNAAAQSGGGGVSTTTWNAAFNSNFTYTNGNKTAQITTDGTNQTVKAILGKSAAGSFTVTPSVVGTNIEIGFGDSTMTGLDWAGSGSSASYFSTGSLFFDGASVQTGLATYGIGDVITASWDGAGHVQFKKNGTNVGTPVDASSKLTGTVYPIASAKDINTALTLDATNWG